MDFHRAVLAFQTALLALLVGGLVGVVLSIGSTPIL
jgi:hypothetical protein